MRVTVDRKAFVRSLSTVARATDRKSSNPALAYVRLTARDGELVLTGTDLRRIYESAPLPACGAETFVSGALALDARALLATAKGFTGLAITIESEALAADASIRSDGASARLAGFPVDDMPPTAPTLARLRAAHAYTLPAPTVRAALSVAFCASQDETRPHLAGVLLEIGEGSARGVATDGHRLAVRGPEGFHPILIPVAAAEDWIKALPKSGDVTIAIDAGGATTTGRSAALFVDGSALSSVLTPEHFPPYAKVIPKGNATEVRLDTKVAIAALKRARVAAVASGSKGMGVILSMDDGALRIATDSSVETIPVGEGSAVKLDRVGFNVDYLLDALKHAGSSIVAAFAGALDPVVVKSGDDVDVVMPMRV